jgi:hypothetical protein
MKKYFLSAILALLISGVTTAQKNVIPKSHQYADLSFGLGSKQGSIVAGYFCNKNLGKKHRLFIGTGLRFNTFYGTNVNYTSAASNLAGDKLKEDTLSATKSSVYSLNLLINLGYNITPKLQAGFNIDLLGFSFGQEGSLIFKSNGIPTVVKAKPTSFNALLIGNNDRGSVNSEFYARYRISNKFGAKLAYQYFFTELKTNVKIQTVPELNDRFRNKARLINVGFTYYF